MNRIQRGGNGQTPLAQQILGIKRTSSYNSLHIYPQYTVNLCFWDLFIFPF